MEQNNKKENNVMQLMKFVHVYKIKPEYRDNVEEWWHDYDLDISKYEFSNVEKVNYSTIQNLIDTIERKEVGFELEETDLIEVCQNLSNFEDSIDFNKEMNFILITGLGAKQIAIDHKHFNEDLAWKNLSSLF